MSGYTLFHGDCLDILPALGDASIDAIIADIPSGRTACAWDSVIPFDLMWAQLRRIIKPRGAIVLLGCTQPFTSALIMSNVAMFRYEWIWEKGNGGNVALTGWQPHRCHEAITVFSDGKPLYYPQRTYAPDNRARRILRKPERAGGAYGENRRAGISQYDQTRLPRSVQRFATDKRSNQFVKQATIHPTQKPLLLLEYLVKTYTNPGETVLDFCYGSGTTGHACANLDRSFVGIEKDDQYFTTGENRIASAYAPLRAMQQAAQG
jgi:hypothetical protein